MTLANANFSALVAQFNSALSAATVTNGGIVSSNQDVSSQFQIIGSNGQLQVQATEAQQNPNYAAVTLGPSTAAFGEVYLEGTFSSTTVAYALIAAANELTVPQNAAGSVYALTLPFVDASLPSLWDFRGSLVTQIDNLINNPASSITALPAAIANALGINPGAVSVAFDSTNDYYRVDIEYATGYATTKPLDVNFAALQAYADSTSATSLGNAVSSGITKIADLGGDSPVSITATATIELSVGIDLSNPQNPRYFLITHDSTSNYTLGHGTAVTIDFSMQADTVNFNTSYGNFGVYVEGGSFNVSGPALTTTDGSGNTVPVYTYDATNEALTLVTTGPDASYTIALNSSDSGATPLPGSTSVGSYRIYLESSGSVVTTASDYTETMAGSAQVNLPVFTPTASINPFNSTAPYDGSGNPAVYIQLNGTIYSNQDSAYTSAGGADVVIAGNAITVEIDDLGLFGNQRVNGADSTNPSVQAFVPDITNANGGIQTPTVFDLLENPALLLDGLDALLGLVQDGLQALNSLNIPVIGPTLGSAVDNIFNFREGWLKTMEAEMSNAGQRVFEYAKDAIYQYLGPQGIGILLKQLQPGESEDVNSIVAASSPDDVTLTFLDANGNPVVGTGGFGASGVLFGIRLGSVLVSTGANISFDFSDLEPAFGLSVSGGVSFKVGWDLNLSFGINLTDGFFIDANANQDLIQLRFEGTLDGNEVNFSVLADPASPTGFAISNGAGSFVQGMYYENNAVLLPVMEVDSTGTPVAENTWDTTYGQTGSEYNTTLLGGAPAAPATVYWVVAAQLQDSNGNPIANTTTYTSGGANLNSDGSVAGNDRYKYVPATLNSLGYYNAQAPGSFDPTKEILYNQTAPFVATGNLFFLQLSAQDMVQQGLTPAGANDYSWGYDQPQITQNQRGDADSGVDRNNSLPSLISGQIGIAFVDPATLADPSAQGADSFTITYKDFQDYGTKLFSLDLSAQAVINLHLTLSVSSDADIPRVTADFNLDWDTNDMVPPANPFSESDDQKRDLVPFIGVNNIRLDLGSFLTQFIKPIAEDINDGFKPLDPIINALETEIPVISDIAGRPITLVTLLYTFGGGDGKAIATVIDVITMVRDLANVMSNVPSGDDVYLPIGNFWLAKVGAGPTGQPGEGTQIYYSNSEIHTPAFAQSNQSYIANAGPAAKSDESAIGNAMGSLEKLGTSAISSIANALFPSPQDEGGFNIPLLQDPLTVFKLLMGQDVPLVTFALPKLDFVFDIRVPLVQLFVFQAGIHIHIELQGQMSFGYDTYGIREYIQTGNPEELLGRLLYQHARKCGRNRRSGRPARRLRLLRPLRRRGHLPRRCWNRGGVPALGLGAPQRSEQRREAAGQRDIRPDCQPRQSVRPRGYRDYRNGLCRLVRPHIYTAHFHPDRGRLVWGHLRQHPGL